MFTVRRVLSVGVLLFVILACNLPQPASTAVPGAQSTSAALTVAAIVSRAFSPTPMPGSPIPSATAINTFTPIPTLSPTLILTATSSVPLISVSVDTNCRVGPGKVYDRVGGLYVGQTAEVYARNPGGDYWYIRLPENPGIFCWVWGYYATVVGNVAALPVYTPPPTPTPAPGFELSYAGLDSCVGWWVELKLKNTGGAAFKSYSLSVKDTVTDVTLTDYGNGFTDLGGCLTSSVIASLEPGQSAIISAPAFAYNPDNHKIRATVTLCAGLNQSGKCVTETIDFKP
ncbi:MAG: hypothetical protein AB1750_06550 [Chloroflexota bacterium]